MSQLWSQNQTLALMYKRKRSQIGKETKRQKRVPRGWWSEEKKELGEHIIQQRSKPRMLYEIFTTRRLIFFVDDSARCFSQVQCKVHSTVESKP